MNEILLKGEGEDTVAPAEEQATEATALALSADDFSALEERVLRAVELVKKERQARTAAEERAAHTEERAAAAESLLAEHSREQNTHADRLEREIKQLRSERDHVRERVEKLLKQLDSLEL